MSTATESVPGITLEFLRDQDEPSPLRTDVAGFLGRTVRGPVARTAGNGKLRTRPVRVQGWREFVQQYGAPTPARPFGYAVRGYFENGGEVAYICRVGPEPEPATLRWRATGVPQHPSFEIHATSPGTWVRSLEIEIEYLRYGWARAPQLRVIVRAGNEPTEYLNVQLPEVTNNEQANLDPSLDVGAQIAGQINAQSNLVRFVPLPKEDAPHDQVDQDQEILSRNQWEGIQWRSLGGAINELATTPRDYLEAADVMADEPEVAMVAAPDIYTHLSHDTTDAEIQRVYQRLAHGASQDQDRFVLIDVPPGHREADKVIEFVNQMRASLPADTERQAVAVYHPWLQIPDPMIDSDTPTMLVAPSCHVAGVIAGIDLDRGPSHPPANASLLHLTDYAATYSEQEEGLLYGAGVNLIRCLPGRGPVLWGNRTLSLERSSRFLSHRRFIHRLVRAIRLAVAPSVFDDNTQRLRRTIHRTITSLLLQAFQSGVLKGSQPAEAFSIQCDELNNPRAEREVGILLCEIGLRLAEPMEFIKIEITIARQDKLEVFDQ